MLVCFCVASGRTHFLGFSNYSYLLFTCKGLLCPKMEVAVPNYSFKFPLRQQFSFHYSIISYLLETESFHVLLKLQKCCKYFFAKKPILIADTRIRDGSTEDGIGLFTDAGLMLPLTRSNQYWFTNLIFNQRNSYSMLRPYIYRLTLSNLSISDQDLLSLHDIDSLLSNEKLKTLFMVDVNIRDDAGSPVSVDYILGKVPNVIYFAFGNQCEVYSNQKLEKLNSVKLCQKLVYFSMDIFEVSEEINPDILGKFVATNLAPSGHVLLVFGDNERERDAHNEKMEEIVKNWSTPGSGPTYFIS